VSLGSVKCIDGEKEKELNSGVFHPAVSAAGFESAPIMSNGLERIDHAVKRGGPMILHELRIVMNLFTALLGGRANTLHRRVVPGSGDLRIRTIRGRGTVAAIVGRSVVWMLGLRF